MSFFKSNPTKASWTKASPSLYGVPTELENSNGAAPVPPSAPSTAIKSGFIPVFIMALQMAKNSLRFPIQSLNPTGFPSERSRSLFKKLRSPVGVLNSL